MKPRGRGDGTPGDEHSAKGRSQATEADDSTPALLNDQPAPIGALPKWSRCRFVPDVTQA